MGIDSGRIVFIIVGYFINLIFWYLIIKSAIIDGLMVVRKRDERSARKHQHRQELEEQQRRAIRGD
jgi:hypothetical protein